MSAAPDPAESASFEEAMRAVAAWWDDAGVDMAFNDAPQDWLAASRAVEPPGPAAPGARAAAPTPEKPAPPPPQIGGDRAKWPQTLEEFGDWWLAEPSLGHGTGARRVLPAGPAQAALMVLVAHPEREDGSELLSGPQGALLDAILRALGLARPDCYIASALPRHTPAADWRGLAQSGMGAVLAHHVTLADPGRLLVFGRDGLPLLLQPAQTDNDPPQSPRDIRIFNHDGGSVPLCLLPALDQLIERPGRKRGAWQRLLEFTEA